MKIYRVVKEHESEGSCGFAWCSQLREAKRLAQEFRDTWGPGARPEIETVILPSCPTRRDILRLLNHYAEHPDNG